MTPDPSTSSGRSRRPALITIPPALRYALAAVGFGVPAAWLALALACWGLDYAPACWPRAYALAPLAVPLAVLAPLFWRYWERARRRANKGAWRAAGGWRWATLGHTAETVWRGGKGIVWGSEEVEALPPPHPLTERRRWLIPCPNGQQVYVDKSEFYRWWRDGVEPLHAEIEATRGRGKRRSAVSMRYWRGLKFEDRILSEGDVLAFREIMKAVGAVDYRTEYAQSMYYIPGVGSVWSRVERFEEFMKSEEY